MFQWLIKRISTQILAEIMPKLDLKTLISQIDFKEIVINTLQDETVQDEITEFTDALYDRYKVKVMNTLAGLSQNTVTGEAPSIINSKGKINFKGLLPALIDLFYKGKAGNQPQTSSTF